MSAVITQEDRLREKMFAYIAVRHLSDKDAAAALGLMAASVCDYRLKHPQVRPDGWKSGQQRAAERLEQERVRRATLLAAKAKAAAAKKMVVVLAATLPRVTREFQVGEGRINRVSLPQAPWGAM